jgi:hypothetical protein
MKSLRKPKGQIRIRKSNKERQDNSQMKRDNKITMVVKTIHRKKTSSNTNLTKTRVELRCSGRVKGSCTTRYVANPVTSHE